MSTTELERPLCECHGLPVYRSGTLADGRPKTVCRVVQNERSRRGAERRRREAGIPPRPPVMTPDERRARELEQERARRQALREQPADQRARQDAVNASRRAWYAGLGDAERAEHLAYIAAWQRSDVGRASRAATAQARRARKAGVGADFTARHREALLLEYGDRCAYCGARDQLELEHDVPLALGGDHTWRNIVPACRSCNASKGTTTGNAYVLRRLLEGPA